MSYEHKIDAAARLLAAEAEYLSAHGWHPYVMQPATSDKGAVIMWKSGDLTKLQSDAVVFQKKFDKNFVGE